MPVGLASTIEQAWQGDVLLLVPELALVETAQVLLKKEHAGFLTSEESREILQCVMHLPVEIRSHRDLMSSAYELAHEFNLTVYDAIFLSLSKAQKSQLITADKTLENAAIKALKPE